MTPDLRERLATRSGEFKELELFATSTRIDPDLPGKPFVENPRLDALTRGRAETKCLVALANGSEWRECSMLEVVEGSFVESRDFLGRSGLLRLLGLF